MPADNAEKPTVADRSGRSLGELVSAEQPMNLALVNLDTSHVIAFTELIHAGGEPFEGLRVTHAWRGESQVRTPAEIDAYAATLSERFGVTIVDRLDDLPDLVDGALIEANEGSRHLDLARPFLHAGRRCWVDKPLADNFAHARELLALAASGGTQVFSASALRYLPAIDALVTGDAPVLAADVLSPAPQHWANPGLLHYGIHGVEMLLALMGPGCRQVQTVVGGDGEVTVAQWVDGRVGTLRCTYTGGHTYGLRVLLGGDSPRLVQETLSLSDIYRPLVSRVARFLRDGERPLDDAAMLATIAFCDAAAWSGRMRGTGMTLER